jgi:ABC-type multidrug transport system fused ATPase/permease subunit
MNIINDKSEKELLKGTQKPTLKGKVHFENIHFSYPQRIDIEVLKGITFTVNTNETIALVGSSGAGKSTISSLLLNYYNLSSGAILFDDVNGKDIDTEHLRKQMAIVPQEVILFAGTIQENIAFGKPNSTEEEVIEAARQANALEFINSFPEGLKTQVGDRGIQLSGGQKQRIAIARAILKNPTILILDEIVSHLDNKRKEALCEEISMTNIQSFYSATSDELMPNNFVNKMQIINIES